MALNGFRSTPTRSLGKGAPCINFAVPSEWSFEKSSVLVRAILHENTRHVKLLLKKGCNPNKPVGDRNIRPLMMAWYVKNKDKRMTMLKMLLNSSVNPMSTDSEGRNSLMYACALPLHDEVEILVNNSYCDFKAVDAHGNTVLHFCALAGNSSVLRIVLEKMKRYLLHVNARNRNHHTALDVAILCNNCDCARELRKVGGQRTLPKFRVISNVCGSLPRLPEHVSGGSSGWRDRDRRGEVTITDAIGKATYKNRANITQRITSKTNMETHGSKSEHKAQSSDDIVHRLLSLKGKRSTISYCNPSKILVPLDSEWVARTRATMNVCLKKQSRKKVIPCSTSSTGSECSQRCLAEL